ncbi:hypothetical protein [Methanobacterium formicicum]|mgnify:FL=1|uniref:hypothetical protein n=1 Tax=Methanobacterium formicicum TaxID=2162 RepID=UPI002491596D|nr:hypothetical protein [Methanobacterium formicicum]
MKVKGKLYLTHEKVLRFDLEEPQRIENLDEPILFVLYENLQMAILQFGNEKVIKALSGEKVMEEIELPDKIDSYLFPEEKTLVGYV